ncbi:MAG: chalcone isomerase family protein [Deltaproteobacteria bacterium]|nr:chalcone isomerase family protein [Deltaproteobacteria bacterium]
MRKWLLLICLVWLPIAALAVTVEGTHYPATVQIAGKTLKLVGAGLREKWFFDVYTMGAYTENGSCNTRSIIKDEEVKYLRLNMHRDVSAEKMSSSIGESFAEHMPKNASAELKKQRKTFESYFKKECKEGNVIEFVYTPAKGTELKQNGKLLGPVMTGKAFQEVLWDIYFGKDTCCEDLQEQILETCRNK